ncbi:YpfB family protein [Rossellomorea aquimaris]|uniref:YpfB family protein n=1 Tax=Rossellomorea aquimaris TaxID=189382 RepID=A0A1J6WSL7_9BACI|nr:YpfB family protein [Rossellomorea aquimaris]OIU71219.1 hypothetical protein BHE18_09270 [Rossellomorea aquimaris]
MKAVERILIKLAIIHFILLLAIQLVFHELNVLPELHKIVFYEGVEKMEYSEIIETISSNSSR